MTWEILIPLIAKYGIPWAYEFWQTISQHPAPTAEAWDKLLALANKTEEQYLTEARARKLAEATAFKDAVNTALDASAK